MESIRKTEQQSVKNQKAVLERVEIRLANIKVLEVRMYKKSQNETMETN